MQKVCEVFVVAYMGIYTNTVLGTAKYVPFIEVCPHFRGPD